MTDANSTPSDSQEPSSEREQIRVIVIGSKKGITSTIRTLYSLRFAEISEWSSLLPGPNPGQMMSILTRYISKQ